MLGEHGIRLSSGLPENLPTCAGHRLPSPYCPTSSIASSGEPHSSIFLLENLLTSVRPTVRPTEVGQIVQRRWHPWRTSDNARRLQLASFQWLNAARADRVQAVLAKGRLANCLWKWNSSLLRKRRVCIRFRVGFRRSPVKMLSPRQLGRLSPDDSRPFSMSGLPFTANERIRSRSGVLSADDCTCTESSGVRATFRDLSFVPVDQRHSVPGRST